MFANKGKQNTTFQFSFKLSSNKMQKATFKLVLTQRQYVDLSLCLPPLGSGDILFFPGRPSDCPSDCPSVTNRVRSIT